MIKNFISILAITFFTSTVFSAGLADTAWIRLDNGVDLTGWWEWNKDPEKPAWKVEDSMIVVSYPYKNRTHLLTEEHYSNFIAEFEVWLDWGVDSGFFLRCTDHIKTYQITLDNEKGGSIGGVYGEGLGGFKSWEWSLDNDKTMKGESSYFDKEDFSKVWNPQGWNKVRVSIHGNPPVITTWLNDYKNNHYIGEEIYENSVPSASIALQLKGHQDNPEKKVRFRNIRLVSLTNEGELSPVSLLTFSKKHQSSHIETDDNKLFFFDAAGKIRRFDSDKLKNTRQSVPFFPAQ